LIGSAIAIEGFPVLHNRVLQHGVRGMMILISVFTYQQGPDFPGYRALLPCAGAALFIWSGGGIPNRVRHPLSPLNMLRFCGQISYSLYLWHWPLFTFARFSKASLTLDLLDKTMLFVLTVVISYLSWRFVEQPFRERRLAPTRRAAFGTAAVATLILLAGSAGGIALSRTASDRERTAAPLDAYNAYDYQPLYRFGSCFSPARGSFDDACLTLAPGKTNLLLWGDSLAAHYFHGLEGHRFAGPQYPAGDAAGVHADAERGRAGHRAMPRTCRANAGVFRRSQAGPRDHVRRLARIRPSAAI
jgi:hypothetical protein